MAAAGVRQIHSHAMYCPSNQLHTSLIGTLPSIGPGVSARTFRCRTPIVAFVDLVPEELSIHRLLRLRMVPFLQGHLFPFAPFVLPLGPFPFLFLFLWGHSNVHRPFVD